MKFTWTTTIRVALTLLALGGVPGVSAQTRTAVQLQTESLTTPLGVDTPQPLFSWKMQDERSGARQSAYQIEVASAPEKLGQATGKIWDSGKVNSGETRGIAYGGPALAASTRYYWRVTIWDQNGKALAPSAATWWETGLLGGWKAKWIGLEETELRRIRESGAAWVTNPETEVPKGVKDTRHDFRLKFTPNKAVKRAVLYVAGRDTTSAWLNGKQVMQAEARPPWGQMPWKTYVVKDVTDALQSGDNLLAIEVVRYAGGGGSAAAQTAMNAVLYLEAPDGSAELHKTGSGAWRSALDVVGDWYSAAFEDGAWKEPIPYRAPQGDFDVGDLGNPWPTGAVKSLRREFETSKPVKSARIYATALGAYKLSLNGTPVGDQILAPGWTDFRQRVIYQTYDVTPQVKSGKNALGALLAPGWYATPLQWFRQGYNYGSTPPSLRVQLRIEYSDGSVDWVLSDGGWKAEISPILMAEIYDGETQDARRAQKLAGWDKAGFDDRAWKSAEIVAPAEPEILWQYFPPIRVEKTLDARTISSPAAGVYVFDFGQNLSGVARLRTSGAAGTDVRLRFAEVLNADGTIYTENLRTAKATDHFLLSGIGEEQLEPLFTFHGFRYVEVSGVTRKPELADVKAVVFHTDAPFTANLVTGSPMLNQLWSNILWGQRSNFVGVPTDCPQRDERLGWSADAQVFWRTAAYNMDLATFSRKFGADLRGTQVGTDMYGIFAPGTLTPNPGYGTGWSDAGVIIPWTAWIQTGDKRVIEENWNGMAKYLAAIEDANPDYAWKHNYGIPFADWLSPEGVTPVDLIATAYWAYDARLMKEMAHASGRSKDEAKYAELFEKIKASFIKNYTGPDGTVRGVPPPPVFASGTASKISDVPVETQTGYVLAINMDLLPQNLRAAAGKKLVERIEKNNGRLGTGFLGTPYLLAALTDTGHLDTAYRLLLSTEYPSWGYLVDHGATTMWERWNGDQMRSDPSMNSYNHYAYGAVADWIYRYAAGIDTDANDPGFHTIRLHPNFSARIGSVDLSYNSAQGEIRSAWTVTGQQAKWKLSIPANARGVLSLTGIEARSYSLGGKSLSAGKLHAQKNGEQTEYELPAGSYEFTVRLP